MVLEGMRRRHLKREQTGHLLTMARERAEKVEGDRIEDEYEAGREANGQLQLGVEQGSDAAVCRGRHHKRGGHGNMGAVSTV